MLRLFPRCSADGLGILSLSPNERIGTTEEAFPSNTYYARVRKFVRSCPDIERGFEILASLGADV
jgi:hypothetical protein